MKKNTKTQLLYRNIEKKDVNCLFSKWNEIKNIIDKNFNNTDSDKQYQVYFRENITNLQKNFIPFKIEMLLDLEEKRAYKVDDSFSRGYLEEKGLEFVSDKRLKDGWIEFINQTIIYPKLYDDNEYESNYIKMIEEKTKEENSYSQEDDQYFSGKILFSIKGKNKRIAFINEIMNCNSKINNSKIEKIYSKYVGVETAKNNMKYFK